MKDEEMSLSKLTELSEEIYKKANDVRQTLIWSFVTTIWLLSIFLIGYYYGSDIEKIPMQVLKPWVGIAAFLGFFGFLFAFSNYRMIPILKKFERVYWVNSYISAFESFKPIWKRGILQVLDRFLIAGVVGEKGSVGISKVVRNKIFKYKSTKYAFDLFVKNLKTEYNTFSLFVKRFTIKEPVDDKKLSEIKNIVSAKILDNILEHYRRIIIVTTSSFADSAIEFARKEEDVIFDLIEERKDNFHVIMVGQKIP